MKDLASLNIESEQSQQQIALPFVLCSMQRAKYSKFYIKYNMNDESQCVRWLNSSKQIIKNEEKCARPIHSYARHSPHQHTEPEKAAMCNEHDKNELKSLFFSE